MKYILAVDQSTSGTKVSLLDEKLTNVKSLKKAHRQYYPHPGWAEHDAEEIWTNTAQMLSELAEGLDPKDIAGLGIANQRETTVLWERQTGKPVCPAVVWQDVRAKELTERMPCEGGRIFGKTGLLLSPYYSAAKAAAVLEANEDLRRRAEAGELCFGTVDSYLLYRLTGGESFATDTTNACRTQLFDITRLAWSPYLAGIFGIPESMLADKVLPADSRFGEISAIDSLKGVPVTALMGDSHASFFGHGCLSPGMVKTSYGTGSSLMMNIGRTPLFSENGLSTSIGFSFAGETWYVLEGNITCSADTLMWVKDELGLISDMEELSLAGSVTSTDGVYLVPAFSGLGAPYFDENAKGMLFGMNRGTTKAHVLRAALASIAHQNTDVLDAMAKDAGQAIDELRADGGGSVNPLLMQMQSDYVPCTVAVSAEKDLTLKGVAAMAGLSAGLFDLSACSYPVSAHYRPKMPEEERLRERAGWLDAVNRCR